LMAARSAPARMPALATASETRDPAGMVNTPGRWTWPTTCTVTVPTGGPPPPDAVLEDANPLAVGPRLPSAEPDCDGATGWGVLAALAQATRAPKPTAATRTTSRSPAAAARGPLSRAPRRDAGTVRNRGPGGTGRRCRPPRAPAEGCADSCRGALAPASIQPRSGSQGTTSAPDARTGRSTGAVRSADSSSARTRAEDSDGRRRDGIPAR
jgi:hypothetical protein